MRICPKCHESVGENLKECPLCKYHFTEEDNAEFKKEKEELERGEAKQIEELRAKRAKMRVIFFLLMMVSIFAPFALGGMLATFTHNLNFFIYFSVSGIVLGTAVLITGILNGAFRCPYCDTVLFRNYGKYCSHCGKQLYY